MGRKTVYLLVIMVFFFTLCGCGQTKTEKSEGNTEVTVVLPEDDTVGGYRTKQPDLAYFAQEEETPISYCANQNSKVFHRADSSCCKRIKEENRYFSDQREELFALGYRPCSICAP